MAALTPDYDSDPERRAAWQAPQDVHEMVGPEISGSVLDVGCGEGRLVAQLRDGTQWCGVDSSDAQLARCDARPVVRADMCTLPFRSDTFAVVTHLWCLYHVDAPTAAIEEACRVLGPGGNYYASTGARNSDPELMWEGYPATTFDAEEAAGIVGKVFVDAQAEQWDGKFFALESREEVRMFCRHNSIPVERAETAEVPLWLTKRGVLLRATKPPL